MVDTSYNDIDAQEHFFSVNGKTYEFVDFGPNIGYNNVYRNACQKNAGLYRELTYMLTCMRDTEEIEVHVTGQPRCYSVTCDAMEDQELLDEYSIKPTEQRNNVSECYGTFTNGTESVCQFETDLIYSDPDDSLILANANLKPTVEKQQFMWIFPKAEKLVIFPSDSATESYFGSACEASQGDPTHIGSAHITCSNDDLLTEPPLDFKVLDFLVCFGVTCSGSDEIYYQNVALASGFLSRLLETGELEAGYSCVVTKRNDDGGGPSFLEKHGTWVLIGAAGLLVLLVSVLVVVNKINSGKD
jgi:hypothetical protein